MSYASAAAWVAAMNAANYLGHANWQIPTTPSFDRGCTKTGPNGNSFGYNCAAGAFGTLYYTNLGLIAPATAVAIPTTAVGAFRNLQPYLYWSQTSAGTAGNNTFSFATGWQGANTPTHVMYVFPMIPGKLTIASPGTVYDAVANVTWAANANLAATNTFGLPACRGVTSATLCVNPDGAMSLDSATQFITNMNSVSYLGQASWQLPPVDPTCSGFNCGGKQNPMGELFYGQLALIKGASAVATPDIAVGPFHNLQPYLYWSCLGANIVAACSSNQPVANQEFSFSFGNGFEGTDAVINNLFAIAYFVGAPTPVTGPVISQVSNAAGAIPTLAPNTWISLYGLNLAPPNDSRTWQDSDFAGGQMPSTLDGVSATVNGKTAYVAYISPAQVNILTPPDPISGVVPVVLTNNGAVAASFTAPAQTVSPSFFTVNGGPYLAAQHANSTPIGPASPAQPGEVVVLYANGFGATSVPVVAGSSTQSGILITQPLITIGGQPAAVQFAGLTGLGLFQFNVVVPPSLGNGDQPVVATYNGASTQSGVLLTVHN